jgi:hypothetical protein
VNEEEPLVAAGLRFLISLAPSASTSISDDEHGANEGLRQPLEFCVGNASAKFILEWRAKVILCGGTGLTKRR